jgi:CheY-like chemotaxis protein
VVAGTRSAVVACGIAAPAEVRPTTKRILLVDDEPGLRLTLTRRLSSEGYEVSVATDGEQGFARASTESFDLIVLDVMLPGRNGFDVCRDLRRCGVDTPLLMLTARGQVRDRVFGLKLGADDYLMKPFDMSELRARIEARLRPASSAGSVTPGDTYHFGPVHVHFRRAEVECEGVVVVGVLEAKGQSMMGTDQDNVVLLPLRTFHRRLAGNQDVGLIQVSVRESESTERARIEITALMRARRHISGSKPDDFQVTDMKEISGVLAGTTRLLTALLSAVAAVSLLVGGIGIMNIMLVSVTERTREIGIRLAIGALEREVLTQFLVEAVALSSFGGVVGIVLAVATSFGLARALRVPFILDPGIVVIAFLFSAAVGMIFGFFPAQRAARVDPIEALRHE